MTLSHLSAAYRSETYYFLLTPRHEKFIAGGVKFHSLSMPQRIITWIGTFIIILWWFFFCGLPAFRSILYQVASVPATATIRQMEERPIKGSPSYFITYTFNAINNETVFVDVPYALYSQWHSGDSIPIRYIPNFSDISALTEDIFAGRRRAFDLIAGIIFFIICGKVFQQVYVPMWRENRILNRSGKILQGEITEITSLDRDLTLFHWNQIRFQWKLHWIILSYSFIEPEGNTISGKTSDVRNELRDKPLPPPHTPLLILYAAKEHHTVL